jgi:hypothetical protein
LPSQAQLFGPHISQRGEAATKKEKDWWIIGLMDWCGLNRPPQILREKRKS